MKKRILFVPMPEYGHVIPTLKLAKKFVSDGWKVDYLVYEEFASFLQEQGLEAVIEKSRRIAPFGDNAWKRPKTKDIKHFFNSSLEKIDNYGLILFDFYVSYCALGVDNCESKCVTYITNADCESYKSPPLCFYIKTEFVRKLPGISKLLWLAIWRKRYNYDRLLMGVGLKKMPPDIEEDKIDGEDIRSEIRKRKLAGFPSPFGSVGLDLNTIVLGPRALSQQHLPEERYLGFCLDNAGIGNVETYESFARSQKKVTYCSFGSMNKRYPEALKILEAILEAFRDGELGGLILQAGSYYERMVTYESAHIRIIKSANQKEILSVADYTITHGGYGTQKECVRYGVPMVVIPLFIDQFHNATTVARLGLGCVVRRKNVNADNIRKTIKDLMLNEIYKRNLSKVYNKQRDDSEFDQGYRFLLRRIEETAQRPAMINVK